MQLCVIAEGQFGVVHGRDERLWLGPGAGLQLLDCHRTAQTYSEISYRAYPITLPRAAVYRAMGGDPIAGTGALRSLPDPPLAWKRKSLNSSHKCAPRLPSSAIKTKK